MNKTKLVAILIIVVAVGVTQKAFSESLNSDQDIMNTQNNQFLSQDYTEETTIEDTDEVNTDDSDADENNNDEEVIIEDDNDGNTDE